MCNVHRYHEEGGGRLCHPDRDVVAEGDDVLLSPPLLQSLLADSSPRHHLTPPDGRRQQNSRCDIQFAVLLLLSPKSVDVDVAVGDDDDVDLVEQVEDPSETTSVRS